MHCGRQPLSGRRRFEEGDDHWSGGARVAFSRPSLPGTASLRVFAMGDRGEIRDEATSDEELMVRVAGGELDAFGILVERHHGRALNFAFRLCGDVEQSKDVVQESFLRVLKAARRYRPRAAFTTYLFHVVRNLVLETARRAFATVS